jgi:8-oxo-dGTP pyrophosphatase MutT (NUDIX family)
MTQKYAVYWNQKVLFFNNPQGIHQQLDKVIVCPGSDSTALQEAISMLKNSEDDYCQIFMSDIDFELGMAFLKKQLHFIMAAGGIVETPDQQSLFIHRLGCWDLPKGKLEKGEKMKDAAVREVEEECSIRVERGKKICNTWHSYNLDGKRILKKTAWYVMDCLDDKKMKPQKEEGIDAIRWMTEKEAVEALHDSYKSILEVLNCHLQEESKNKEKRA